MKNSKKSIKTNQSSRLRLTKEDKQQINIKDNDKLLKTVSKDDKKIIQQNRNLDSETQNMIDLIFKEDQAGIDKLKKL